MGIEVGSWRCPRGVHSIVRVDVFGTGVSTSSINGVWTGSALKAYVEVKGVPASGGQARFVAAYRCKTQWFGLPSGAYPAEGLRWVYGSGYQPSYIL
ncbi:hypothetical protein [Planobispora longispora]|uniref:hypothetical protein n=1 Tax=Planobispora longispora TaxID=28887 RepID=UPI00194319F7|nr:hypothetical protein [Planobispora longispora]